MTRPVTVMDARGVIRSGPFGAWWAWLAPRHRNALGISLELPSGRAIAWNVAGVVYVAGAVYGAAHVGHLAVFLTVLAGMVTVTGFVLAWLARRNDVASHPGRAPEEISEYAQPARPARDEVAA